MGTAVTGKKADNTRCARRRLWPCAFAHWSPAPTTFFVEWRASTGTRAAHPPSALSRPRKKLCRRACVDEILQCKALGGRPEWRLEDFLSKDIWLELGGKAGIKECSKTLLTVIAAAGRKEGRINP